jgi:hypothetical protein
MPDHRPPAAALAVEQRPVTVADIPPDVKALIDEAAGRQHSDGGAVMATFVAAVNLLHRSTEATEPTDDEIRIAKLEAAVTRSNRAAQRRGEERDRLRAENAGLLAEVERLREQNTGLGVRIQQAWQIRERLEAEVERQARRMAELHAGAHQLSVEAFIGMGDAVMTTIADGGSLADVLDVVGDWLNGRDAIDEESEALFNRAKATVLRAAAPASEDDEHARDCLHDEPGVTICTCRPTAGSPPPTPAPTGPDFDQVQAAVAEPLLRWTDDMHPKTVPEIVAEVARAVMALIAQPDREPLWRGKTTAPWAVDQPSEPGVSYIDAPIPGPPGTAVRVVEDQP